MGPALDHRPSSTRAWVAIWASIGAVTTAMFEPDADHSHLEKLDRMPHSWVDFVKDDAAAGVDFKSFQVNPDQSGHGILEHPRFSADRSSISLTAGGR